MAKPKTFKPTKTQFHHALALMRSIFTQPECGKLARHLRKPSKYDNIVDIAVDICHGSIVDATRLVDAIVRTDKIIEAADQHGMQSEEGKFAYLRSTDMQHIVRSLEQIAGSVPKYSNASFVPDVNFDEYWPGVHRDDNHRNFYKTSAWLSLRYEALKASRGCCECCGRRAGYNLALHVDHTKSRSRYPELALELSNLQVLCEDCNLGKGALDETDWRPSET